MNDTKKLILAAIVVGLLLIGMVIGSKTGKWTTFPQVVNQTIPTPQVSPAPSQVVTIENYAYNPANLVVKAGDTVTWENKDSVAHTATSDNNFDTGIIEPGESYTVTFDTPGTYSYYCIPHPQMTGTIIVE